MNIPEPLMVVVRPLLNVLARLPGWFSRWYWSPQKLAEKVEIECCTDRRSVYLNGADIPSVSVNLKVTNLLPFEVRIESLWCDVRFVGGTIARLQLMRSQPIEPHSRAVVFLDGTMTAPQRDSVERLTQAEHDKYVKDAQLRVLLRGDLTCKVRPFFIDGREPSVPAPEFVNFRHKTVAG